MKSEARYFPSSFLDKIQTPAVEEKEDLKASTHTHNKEPLREGRLGHSPLKL